MSFLGDLHEAKQFWKDSSWQFRGTIIFARFLAVSPIASLSDIIFQWKGFILDALTFYKQWFTLPIREFAARFGLRWSQYELDAFFVFALGISGSIRFDTYMRSIYPGSTLFSLKHSISPVVTFLLWGLTLGLTNGIFILEWVFFIYVVIFYGQMAFLHYAYSAGAFLIYIAPTITAITIVLLLGAINAGLIR